MPKVSNRPLDKEKLASYQTNIFKALTLSESFEETKSFMLDLLSRTEMIMLAKRFEIAIELLNGSNYIEIGKKLNVSPDTILAVKEKLESGHNGYLLAYNKLQELEQEKINRETNRIKRMTTFSRSKSPAEKLLPELGAIVAKTVGKKIKKYLKKKSVPI